MYYCLSELNSYSVFPVSSKKKEKHCYIASTSETLNLLTVEANVGNIYMLLSNSCNSIYYFC